MPHSRFSPSSISGRPMDRSQTKEELRHNATQRGIMCTFLQEASKHKSESSGKFSSTFMLLNNSPMRASESSLSGVKLADPIYGSSGESANVPSLKSCSSSDSTDSMFRWITNTDMFKRLPYDVPAYPSDESDFASEKESIENFIGQFLDISLEQQSTISALSNSSYSVDVDLSCVDKRQESRSIFLSRPDSFSLRFFRKARKSLPNSMKPTNIFRKNSEGQQNVQRKKSEESEQRRRFINVKVFENFRIIGGRQKKKDELKHIECVIVPPPPPGSWQSDDDSTIATTRSTKLLLEKQLQGSILIISPSFKYEPPADSNEEDEEYEEFTANMRSSQSGKEKSVHSKNNSNSSSSSYKTAIEESMTDDSNNYELFNMSACEIGVEGSGFTRNLILKVCPILWRLIDDPYSAAKRCDLESLKYFASLDNQAYNDEYWYDVFLHICNNEPAVDRSKEVIQYILSLVENSSCKQKLNEYVSNMKPSELKGSLSPMLEEIQFQHMNISKEKVI
eukprot:CAMPEP_0113312230 /NCGR_PEP_ID=MMETSP0010_2-20120614/9140_1 /TAXON_ID=216773 ORGANISM="Corethron hystrix, Strain 308" /NCGR_SAMPLE_ID=MMETSP0010_2 /ASSEMBLY_ACC=CAM_ASM_000155 /LENGTH=507 /DNA_ID=CAMNT_0000168007 /DNA_START=169 /DNA_END=1692 /DNA_ORIENTATION=- /assembly_acc=CAM_ASM_000155